MTLVVKVIAIKAELFDVEKVMKNIESALDNSGKRMQQKFAKTIEGWTGERIENPTMEYEVEMGSKDAAVWAGPSGSEMAVNKWKWLDEGRDAQDKPPGALGYMAYPWQGKGNSYKASTKPRQFSSGAKQKLGTRSRVYHSVHHDPIEPREWSLEMADQEVPLLTKEIQEAIDEGLA